MVVARSVKEVTDFVTSADLKRPEGQRTKFHLRTLPTLAMVRITELVGDNTALFELVLRAALDGWTNMAISDGTPLAAVHDPGDHLIHGVTITRPLSMESLNALDAETAGEVITEIMTRNSLTDDDVKN